MVWSICHTMAVQNHQHFLMIDYSHLQAHYILSSYMQYHAFIFSLPDFGGKFHTTNQFNLELELLLVVRLQNANKNAG